MTIYQCHQCGRPHATDEPACPVVVAVVQTPSDHGIPVVRGRFVDFMNSQPRVVIDGKEVRAIVQNLEVVAIIDDRECLS